MYLILSILYFSKSKPESSHKPIRVRHWGDKPEQFLENSELLKTERQINFDVSLFKEPKKTAHQIDANVVSLSEIFYISWGLRPCSNEKTHRGLFKKQNLISNFEDSKHPKAYIEGKDTVKWWIKGVRYLEWNTERSPNLIARPTFPKLYDVPEKILAMKVLGKEPRAVYDNQQLICNDSVSCCVFWHYLQEVRNNSIKKSAKYSDELSINQSPLPTLREKLEEISKQFNVKYVLAVMNLTFAKDWLAKNRRDNKQLYPDDWKKLPIAIASKEEQIKLADLVDAIFAEFKQSNSSLSQSSEQRIKDLEKEIDDRVAALYGL